MSQSRFVFVPLDYANRDNANTVEGELITNKENGHVYIRKADGSLVSKTEDVDKLISGEISAGNAVKVFGKDQIAAQKFFGADYNTSPGIFKHTFYVHGDADTYYPVIFDVRFIHGGPRNFIIRRSYSDTAPESWHNSATHHAGLELYMELSKNVWSANLIQTKITRHWYVYERTFAGMFNHGRGAGSVVVWLRGGGAYYEFYAPIDYKTRNWSKEDLDAYEQRITDIESSSDSYDGEIKHWSYDTLEILDGIENADDAIHHWNRNWDGDSWSYNVKLPKATYSKDEVYARNNKLGDENQGLCVGRGYLKGMLEDGSSDGTDNGSDVKGVYRAYVYSGKDIEAGRQR